MAAQPDMPMPNTLGQVVFDEAFPDEPIEFTHDLCLDDRLTIASVADLAGRLQPKSVVFDTAALPLLAPVASPAGVLERPGDVIRDLHNANAWLTLLNVEDDPDYAKLVNGLFDQLRPGVTAKQGKMKIVGGFIFLSSPNSVTPIHYDIEFNFLLQVSGTKVVHLGRYESEAARRHEFDRYWDGALGRIETLPEEVATYTVSAGQALYIPPGTPHWVHNGPDVSLSLTLAYLTPATVRENRIEDFNAGLRKLHLHPREPGHSNAADTAKVCAMGVWAVGRRLRSAVAGWKQRDSKAAAPAAAYRMKGS